MLVFVCMSTTLLAGCAGQDNALVQQNDTVQQDNQLAIHSSNKLSPLVLSTGPVNGLIKAAGGYIVWVAASNNSFSLHGYDLNTQKEFPVGQAGQDLYEFATDGDTVVWVGSATMSGHSSTAPAIQVFNLKTKQAKTLILGEGSNVPGNISIDRGTLYYFDRRANHVGTYAHTLATGGEMLITTQYRAEMVVADGTMLWTEEYRVGAVTGPATHKRKLHISELDGSVSDTVVADVDILTGYGVSGSKIVYGSRGSEYEVREYDVATKSSRILATGATEPVVLGSNVAWVTNRVTSNDGEKSTSVGTVNLSKSQNLPVTNATITGLSVSKAALTGSGTVAFTVDDSPQLGWSIYVTSLNQTNATIAKMSSLNSKEAVSSCNNTPINCGQVKIALGGGGNNYYLADDGGTWLMKGVMFLFPENGISGKSFRSDNYRAAKSRMIDGLNEVDFMLLKAGNRVPAGMVNRQNYLKANLVRIYALAPSGQLSASGEPSTCNYKNGADAELLIEFIRRANDFGLRTGLVIQDSTAAPSPCSRYWLKTEVLQKLRAQNLTQLIAYVNYDNEVNNHYSQQYCRKIIVFPPTGPGPEVYALPDCFDLIGNYSAVIMLAFDCLTHQKYIDDRMAWVRDINSIIEEFNAAQPTSKRLLTTVGLSTEMYDVDSAPAVQGFFKKATTIDARHPERKSLADYTDFLAPHRYGSDAQVLVRKLRSGGDGGLANGERYMVECQHEQHQEQRNLS